jgi:Fe2+ or Zn2+ uptake regulation protein
MDIFDLSKVTMAKLILESTSHRYYAREVHDITGLSYPTIYGNFSAFERAGFVVRKEEDWGTYTGRAAQIGYEPTQQFIDFVRLTPQSSVLPSI